MGQFKVRSKITDKDILIKKLNEPNLITNEEERKKNDDIEFEPKVV